MVSGREASIFFSSIEQQNKNMKTFWKGYQGGYNGTTDHTQRQHTQAKNENENIISIIKW